MNFVTRGLNGATLSAFSAHRGESIEQFRLVPRHIDDVLAQVMARRVAQPLLRKPHHEAFLAIVEVASRR